MISMRWMWLILCCIVVFRGSLAVAQDDADSKPDKDAETPAAVEGSSQEKAPADESDAPQEEASPKAAESSYRGEMLLASLTIFALAIFVGFELITKVPPTLHTPLMSGSNAISGIAVVGAILVAGNGMNFSSFLGMVALALAMVNVVGGFLVTHRMLAMFQKK